MWHKLNRMILAAAMAAVVVFGLLGGRLALADTYTAVDLNPSGFYYSYN